MKSKILQLNSSTVLCCEGCSLSSVVRNAIVVVQSLNSSFFKLFIYKRGKMIWICWAKSKLHNKTATSSVVFQFRRIMWLLSDCCSVESNYRVELWTVIKANIPLQSDNCISAHSRKLSQLNTANTPERRRHKQRKIVWELTDVYCLTKCISSPLLSQQQRYFSIQYRGAADATGLCTEGSVTGWRDCLDNVGVRHTACLE